MPKVRREFRHAWQVPTAEAEEIQRRLARHVVLRPFAPEGDARTAGSVVAGGVAAGVDVAYTADGRRAWAAAVVMNEWFGVLEQVVIDGVPDRPYAPGLLAFREGALTVRALEALTVQPDLVFLDGHGVVHERGLGLASHIGVLMDMATIGIPKTPFHAIDRMPETSRGSYYVLTKEWGAQGASLRLKTGVKPVYVSPGHRMDLTSAIALSMAWSTGKRKVPEPLAAAHTLATRAKNSAA